MTPFPWAEVMRFGLGVLRLPPAAFWAMTPRELASAMSGAAGRTARLRPPERQALEALMTIYPDGERDER